MTLKIRF